MECAPEQHPQNNGIEITEQFRLERTLGLYSKLLLNAGSALRSDNVAQGFVQLGLENLQQWRLHNTSGKPFLMPHCPESENHTTERHH